MKTEDTILNNVSGKGEKTITSQKPVEEVKNKFPWKTVGLGSASGILLGASSTHAAEDYLRSHAETNAEEAAFHTLDNGLKVAHVSDDLSFDEAFELARTTVGPGGVFHWQGRTYSTFSPDEFNVMSDTEKLQYAELIRPEISPEEISSSVTENPVEEAELDINHTSDNVLRVAHVSDNLSFGEAFAQARAEVGPGGVFHWHGNAYGTYYADEWNAMSDAEKAEYYETVRPAITSQEYSTFVPDDSVHVAQTSTGDADVQVIRQGYIDGHEAVALDVTGNGEADVVVVDVNDNQVLDEADVLVDQQGNVATMGQLAEAQGYGENPAGTYVNTDDLQDMTGGDDIDSSMPDYVDDADLVII